MGSQNRKRAQATGKVFRDGHLVDQKKIPTFAIKGAIKAGIAALKHESTPNQIQALSDSTRTGGLSPSRLRRALEDNAPKEMRKGDAKLAKKGTQPTVDLLLEEYRADQGFQNMAANVGLDESWFIKLAEAECERWAK